MSDEPGAAHGEGFFRSLADLIPGVVWTARPDGWIDYANRFWLDYTGLTREETYGAGWTRAVHPDDTPRVLEVWTEALGTGALPGLEYRVRHAADGAYKWFLAQGYAMRGPDGAVLKWFGMLSEIEDQKRAAKALERQNALITLLHRVALGSFASHSTPEALALALEQVCTHTGWPVGHAYLVDPTAPDLLVPSGLWYLASPEEFASFREVTMQTRLARGEGLPGRVLATRSPAWIMDVTRDGNFPRTRAAHDLGVKGAFGFPVITSAGVAAVLEFFTRHPSEPDPSLLEAMAQIGLQLGQVFDRQAAAARLESARAAADAANRAKSDFVARMSHELRTPLNSVLGFAQLLELGTDPGSRRAHVDQILKAGRHLLALINEVLDLARIESGQLALSPAPVALHALILEALELVHPHAEREQVALHPPPPDPVRVHADPQRLRQVLLNLLSNAIKYGKRVEFPSPPLRPPRVDLALDSPSASQVRLRIRDTGPGIPPSKLDKLFKPFERLGAEAGPTDGTGLGLAVSRLLAEAMGGTLTLETTGPAGTTFALVLPKAVPPP